MKEYIERALAVQELEVLRQEYEMHDDCDELVARRCRDALSAVPAADVAEVRHGRWIGLEYDGYADGCPVYDLWECSECGEEVRGDDVPSTHPWCHSCGARMDKEDNNDSGRDV